MALRKVEVTDFCPTTVSNVCGRYLRADTINSSLITYKYTMKFLMKMGFVDNFQKKEKPHLHGAFTIVISY